MKSEELKVQEDCMDWSFVAESGGVGVEGHEVYHRGEPNTKMGAQPDHDFPNAQGRKETLNPWTRSKMSDAGDGAAEDV